MKIYPLTPEQQGLWIEWKKDPESLAYNTTFQLKMEGELDVELLQKAIAFVREKLDLYRTRFIEEESVVHQVILSPEETRAQYGELPDFEIIDFSKSKAPEDIPEQAEILALKKYQRKYDLLQYPLEHFTLIKYARDKYLFFLTSHHIISDAHTGMFSFQMIANYYNHSWLTPLAIWGYEKAGYTPDMEKYFAFMEKEYPVAKQRMDVLYWQEVLKEAVLRMDFSLPPVTVLTTPVIEIAGGGAAQKSRLRDECVRLNFRVSEKQTTQLQTLVKAEKTTLFVVLAAAFNVFLYRYFGQEDLTIYYPSSMRPKGFEMLTGFFANTLLLRTLITEEVSFKELIRQVSKQRLADREHRYFSYGELVNVLRKTNPALSLPNVGMAQTLFGLHNLSFSGLRLEAGRPDAHEAVSDLLFLYDFDETQKELILGFECRKSLFAEDFVLQMQQHFLLLLERMLRNLDAPLSRIPLLSDEENHKLLVECNQTASSYPKDRTIHELFEEQVERTPDNIAVIFEDQRLTYRELNEKANQLSHYLRMEGVGPDVLVGICVDPNLEMMIGILGILKAGGGYVPLEPQSPQRIRTILEEARLTFILTQNSYRSIFSLPQTVCLDTDKIRWEDCPRINLSNITQPQNLMYVLYTSGSTGKPKGVMIEHRSLVNNLHWLGKAWKVTAEDCILQRTAYSFDPSLHEFFLTTLVGGRIIIASQEDRKDPAKLTWLIHKWQVTLFQAAAPLFKMLVSEHAFEKCDFLRCVGVGGEASNLTDMDLFVREKPQTRLFNLYGPTETTIEASFWEYRKEALLSGMAVAPIGKPIQNTRYYILDTRRNLVPQGITGELYIAGDCLARGYLNQEGLTRERFIENPFATEEDRRTGRNLRLYKTGDLVRYLPDGNLEFLGRSDFQIKLRGLRIELGEIEAAITKYTHASVMNPIAQALVILREDQPNQKYLAAYMTLRSEVAKLGLGTEIKEGLRKELSQHLPEYMVPRTFVILEEFPLNLSGKIDRKALPIPEFSSPTESYVAPSTEIEKQLAEIWQRLLGIEKISTQSNFFQLGGHSLLAVQAVAMMNKGLNTKLSVSEFFTAPTIAGLAQRIQDGKHLTVVPIVVFNEEGTQPKLFLIHDGTGVSTRAYQLLAAQLKDQSIYAINNPRFGEETAFANIEEMAACYISLMKSVQATGAYRLGGFSMGGIVAYEMARQLTSQGEAVEMVLLIDSHGLADPLSSGADRKKTDILQLFYRRYNEWMLRKSDITPEMGIYRSFAVEVGNDGKILADYQERIITRPYAGRVILLKAQDKEHFSFEDELLEQIKKSPELYQEVTAQLAREHLLCGWAPLVKQGLPLEVYSIQGTHHELFSLQNIQALAYKVAQALVVLPSEILKDEAISSMSNRYFIHAVKNGDEFVVRKMLTRSFVDVTSPIEINVQDAIGRTALHWAAYHGYLEIVQTLIDFGANPEIKDQIGNRALDLAHMQDHDEVRIYLEDTAQKGTRSNAVLAANDSTPQGSALVEAGLFNARGKKKTLSLDGSSAPTISEREDPSKSPR